jgi:hypothetical protein
MHIEGVNELNDTVYEAIIDKISESKAELREKVLKARTLGSEKRIPFNCLAIFDDLSRDDP